MQKDNTHRYARQIAVAQIGKEGQEKLLKARVFVLGCGALGAMAAMQLAGAGIGTIAIADFDNIEITNLQRQFFYSTEEAGKSKAEVLSLRIRDLNPDTEVIVFKELITPTKAEEIFKEFDFIIDATDNPESKKMTGDFCRKYSKACTIAGVRDFEGQVMTFLKDDPSMDDYFGVAGASDFLPCSLSGVMGPTAALAASIQASEAIKYITSAGCLLSGKIFKFDLATNFYKVFTL